MPIQRLDTFTDRREALALFDEVRGRNPNKPWPILPILTLIAPGGSGKSTLMAYLRLKKCSLPDGQAALPYAYLDFTLPSAPKDLLLILMTLRDQLQQHADELDGHGRHLTFPRFDLGALVVQATSTTEDIATLEPHTIQEKLTNSTQLIESLSALKNSLGDTLPVVGPLLAGLKLALQLPVVRDTMASMEAHTGWTWYRRQGTAMGLGAEASMKDVLLRLSMLSRPGKAEREWLINEVLPAAFAADLSDALVDEAHAPRAWYRSTNVVMFLDGYEALQRASSETATRLLQVLSTEPRKQGRTDPVLLVVGSRDQLADLPAEEASLPFARTLIHDEANVKNHMRERYSRWQQRLPAATRFLRLRDLYLPLWLRDFGPEDTRSYLLRFGEQEHTQFFVEQVDLVQMIDRVTRGHPLFLALAAEAAYEAEARGRALTAADFEQAEVSPRIAPEHEAEQIADYLLALFLRQLSDTERKDLILCAVPRVLDAAVLHVLEPSLDELDVQKRWHSYRHHSFVSAIDEQRSVLHPLVRRLLLRRLPVSTDPDSTYIRTHGHLRDHYDRRARKGEEQASLEVAYHALALGDPDPAINLGIRVQQHHLTLWQPLVEAVTQAPTDFLPNTTEARGEEALMRAHQQHEAQSAITVIVLYTWLLSASKDDREHAARLQHTLGMAYMQLPGGDRAANVQQAMASFQATLQVYTREVFPFEWAKAQLTLGAAYADFPGGNREANLERAIACYQAALQVYTREVFPFEWALAQNNLGAAHVQLPTDDREANLEHAIACLTAALQVYTHEAFPFEWARSQLTLAITYATLPSEDRTANLRQAMACFQAALQVFTREAFPFQWASIQHDMGIAYTDFSDGDQSANLEHAIACLTAALQIYTHEAFPFDWASIQHDMGIAYSRLPSGDRTANLRQAMACFQAALQILTSDEQISRNFEEAQDALQQLDKSDAMR